ncbi:hypothetical protein ACLOJK_014629 [Asimina triloba]
MGDRAGSSLCDTVREHRGSRLRPGRATSRSGSKADNTLAQIPGGLIPAHISPVNPHGFVPAQRKPNWPKPTGRLPPLPRASMLPNGVAERTSCSVTHPGTTPTRARLTTKFSPLLPPRSSSRLIV